MKLIILTFVLLSSGSYSMPAERTGKSFYFNLSKCFPCPRPVGINFYPLYCLFFFDTSNLPPCPGNGTILGNADSFSFFDFLPRGVEESDYNATILDEQIEVVKRVFLNDKEYAIFRVFGNQTLQRITIEDLEKDILGPLE